MKPSVTDQLHQTTRALREVVLPHVRDPEARRVAESSIAGLELLERSWVHVLPFLAWDNQRLTELLNERGLDPDTHAGTADGAGTSTDAADVDPLDVEANDRRNDELRRRLEEYLSTRAGDVDLEILDYLDQRARRYPLRYVPKMNTGTDNSGTGPESEEQ